MKIIDVPQGSPEWLQLRYGQITGSQAHSQLVTDASKQKVGFWELLAEKFTSLEAQAPYPGGAMQRGHDLEPINIQLCWQHIREIRGAGLDPGQLDAYPGAWVDEELGLVVTPDACERATHPRWAIECKSLASKTHLEVLAQKKYLDAVYQEDPLDLPTVGSLWPKITPQTQEFDLIPTTAYRGQVLSYFAVNPHLEELYFSMYDDRIRVTSLQHYVLTVRREDIMEDIEDHLRGVRATTAIVDELIDFLITD